MKALLEKEFRALLPYILGALMCGVMVALEAALGAYRPDAVEAPGSEGISGWLLISGLFAFATGHSAISRDFIDGQIEFLDGLPVRRTTIYAAKLLAGAAVPAILLVTTLGSEYLDVLLGSSRTSMSYGSTMMWAAEQYGVGIFAFYAIGVLLAWFNELAWGLLILGVVMMSLLAELVPPVRRFNVLSGYGMLAFDDSTPVDNPDGVTFWLAASAFSVLASWVLFLGPGEAMLRSGSKLLVRFRRRLLIIAGGSFVVLTGLAALASMSDWVARFAPESRLIQTDRFQILYAVADESAVLELAAIADSIDDRVQETLVIEQRIPLDLELFTPPNDFHAGEQSGGKIRLGANAESPAILAHELTHAHAQAITGAAGIANADAWRFFNEGLASYVAGQVYGDEAAQLDELRLWAAAVYDADQASFYLLVVDENRRKRFDTFQVYPLGLVWAETIVAEFGPAAPRCLLEQLGQLGADDYAPIGIWYGIFAGCGFSLDDAVRAYDERLARYVETYGVFDVRLAGRVVGEGRSMLLRVVDEAHAGKRLWCRFRRNADSDAAEMRQVPVKDNFCPVPWDVTGTASFDYQLGYQLSDLAVMYRPWVTAPIR